MHRVQIGMRDVRIDYLRSQHSADGERLLVEELSVAHSGRDEGVESVLRVEHACSGLPGERF